MQIIVRDSLGSFPTVALSFKQARHLWRTKRAATPLARAPL